MLNQTTYQVASTMWMSTVQAHREVLKDDSGLQRRIYWDLNKAIIMIITVVTLIIGVAGNVMILLTVCIRRLMHNPMSYYLANLAVVHTLLSLVVCPFLTFNVLRDAHYRREVCASFFILLYSLALMVAFDVLTIGVDRVWKECWSWHYLSHHSGRRALVVVAGCWVAALTLVTALELSSSAQHPLRSTMCSEGGGETRRLPAAASGDIAIEAIFYTCYGIVFICFVAVQVLYDRKLRKTGHLPGALIGDALIQVPESEADIVRETGARLAPRLNKHVYEDGDQEARSVRVLLLLVSIHTVCWLPFYVVYSLNAHASVDLVPYHIVEIVHYLALLSSPLNPLLYYFSSVEFNMMMGQQLSAMCCRAVSLSSGSTVTLEWESLHRLSSDQLDAFNADADRLSIGMTPSPPGALKVQKSDVAVSVGSSIGDRSRVRRELHELQEADGPSSELYSWRALPPLIPARHRRRPSDSSLLDEVGAAGPNDYSQSQTTASHEPSPSPALVTSIPAPEAVPGSRHRHRGGPGGVSPADSRRSSRSHGVITGMKSLFRHGRPGSRDRAASSRPGSPGGSDLSQPDSTAATPDRPEKRSLAARVAALWHRRRIGQRPAGQPGQRTASEESLVRRLVLAGLPSGVVAGRGRRRLSGVWRSPSGRLHRLDPQADEYPALLERMAANDSGYRTPTGQRIHHVCAMHHVHHQCHHHDVRRAMVAPPTARPRQQTSVSNWTAPGLVEERPAPCLPPPVPPRLDGDSSSSSDSEGVDTVKRITNM